MNATAPTPTPPDYGLSQGDAAAVLGCSRRTIHRLLATGRLLPFGDFRRQKVSCASVAVFLGTGHTPEEVRDYARDLVRQH